VLVLHPLVMNSEFSSSAADRFLTAECRRHLNDLAVAVAGLPPRHDRRLRLSPASADAAATRAWAAALLAHSTSAAAVTAGLVTVLALPALAPRLQQRLVAALDAALRVSSRGIETFCSCGLQGLQGPQRQEAESVARGSFAMAMQAHSQLLLNSLIALAGFKGGRSVPSAVAGPLSEAAVPAPLREPALRQNGRRQPSRPEDKKLCQLPHSSLLQRCLPARRLAAPQGGLQAAGCSARRQ
jgi:hypothetical protein